MNARYLFFGGKGGVGKTTAASATALYLLNKLKQNESILLFSTDPAHSLSDSLDVKIGNRLVEVKQLRGARLFAYEMDASLALQRNDVQLVIDFYAPLKPGLEGNQLRAVAWGGRGGVRVQAIHGGRKPEGPKPAGPPG